MTEQRRAFLIAQQAQALYLQALVSNLTVLGVSLLYFFAMRSRVSPATLLAWVALLWCTAGYRLLLWHRYRRDPSRATATAWLQRYTRATLAVGCAWSLAAIVLSDMNDPVVVAALFILVAGVTSAAVAILSPHLPTFAAYVYPQVFVPAVMLLSREEHEMQLLAAGLGVYLVMLSLFARNDNKMFVRHVYLTSQNEALVQRLNAENARREEVIQERTAALSTTNRALEAEIVERRKAETSLRRLASQDPLTGLPNRLLMLDRLGHAIRRSQRTGTGLAVLFIDLDNFKEINDSQGHTVGDALLKAVSKRLLDVLREEDSVARLGGDEFVVIAEQVCVDADASAIAETIRNAVRDPLPVGPSDLCITTSIGISLYPGDGEDTETLLRNADAAMYRAKAEGRNAFRFYSADMTEKARARVAMEAALRRALREQELRLVFQPQLELHSERLIGAEVLLRWEHPTEGLLLPGRFIAVAESTGQIEQIGAWVLEEVCDRLKRWQAAGIVDVDLAINVSGRQLLHGNLAERIQDALTRSGCDPRRLELEITEGFLIRSPETARATLERVRDLGVRVAIDDFGTGYSSLSYLKQFPIGKIKIDRTFVRDVTLDPNDQAIVAAIVALGKSLGLSAIAEGVETPAQADFLRACGCAQAQGYLYSKPLDEAAFMRYWKTKSRTVPAP